MLRSSWNSSAYPDRSEVVVERNHTRTSKRTHAGQPTPPLVDEASSSGVNAADLRRRSDSAIRIGTCPAPFSIRRARAISPTCPGQPGSSSAGLGTGPGPRRQEGTIDRGEEESPPPPRRRIFSWWRSTALSRCSSSRPQRTNRRSRPQRNRYRMDQSIRVSLTACRQCGEWAGRRADRVSTHGSGSSIGRVRPAQ